MYVAIKKFKESDENEYVGSLHYLNIFTLGQENSPQRDKNPQVAQARPHSQLD